MITSGKHAHTIEAIWWPQNSCDWLRPAVIPFIHFQPVFFDKICKKGMGYLQKITHEWLQTTASNMAAKLSFQFNGREFVLQIYIELTGMRSNSYIHT